MRAVASRQLNGSGTRSSGRRAAVIAAVLAGGLVLGACAANSTAGSPNGETSSSAGSASDLPSSSSQSSSEQTGSSDEQATSPSPADSPGTDTGGSSGAPGSVLGYQFTSVSATGRELMPDKPLTMEFSSADQVGLNAGCNGMGGTPVFSGDQLRVDRIVSTMMACADPDGGNKVMDQEQWFNKWLTAGVSWTADGDTLKLSGDGVTVTFRRTGKADQKASDGETAGVTSSTAHPAVPGEHTPITAPTGTVRATSAPAVGPITPVPASPPGKTTAGGDSVAPPVTVGEAAPLGFLTGKTYQLVRTWSDAGGENRMRKGADFRITFGDNTAEVAGDCRLHYASVRLTGSGSGAGELTMSAPTGPKCTVGSDPAGPPEGKVMVNWRGKDLTVSTGFVQWIFEAV